MTVLDTKSTPDEIRDAIRSISIARQVTITLYPLGVYIETDGLRDPVMCILDRDPNADVSVKDITSQRVISTMPAPGTKHFIEDGAIVMSTNHIKIMCHVYTIINTKMTIYWSEWLPEWAYAHVLETIDDLATPMIDFEQGIVTKPNMIIRSEFGNKLRLIFERHPRLNAESNAWSLNRRWSIYGRDLLFWLKLRMC